MTFLKYVTLSQNRKHGNHALNKCVDSSIPDRSCFFLSDYFKRIVQLCTNNLNDNFYC